MGFAVCVEALDGWVRDPQAPLVQVETFEMSKCPYCSQWKTNFNQVVMGAKGVPQIMNLTEYWVGQNNGDYNFDCLHGPGECTGDTILSCVRYLYPLGLQWWDVSVCMQANGAYVNVPGNAQSCVQQSSLNWNNINNCANSMTGKKLLAASFDYSSAQGVDETPTSKINGQFYVGGSNTPLQTICQAYTGTPPPGCADALKSVVKN